MTRVYRLEITYPEGCRLPGWHPANWTNPDYLRTLTRAQRRDVRALLEKPFRWPRERLYLSSSGAHGRAWLLRFYGCDVEVLSSNPVTWPNLDDWAADERAWERGGTAARSTPYDGRLADAHAKLVEDETVARLRAADEAAGAGVGVYREHAEFWGHYFEEAGHVQDQ